MLVLHAKKLYVYLRCIIWNKRSYFCIISTYYIDMGDYTERENIRTIFCYGGDIDSLIDLAKEKSIRVKSIEEGTDEYEKYNDIHDVSEIYSDKGTSIVGYTHDDDVMIVSTPKDDALVNEWLEGEEEACVVLNHGKEEFSIMGDKYCPTCNQEIKKRTEIIAKCDTGDGCFGDWKVNSWEVVPQTDYEFYLDKKLIAKLIMSYNNSEMNDTKPTIEDFEVENESYKETIVYGIENRLANQGFPGIWLTNYIGYPPETDFWMKMEYTFDIDEGYKELY